jgi:hypothetical protein
MINKDQIESILKINGVTPAAPDEEIRSILLSARYNHDEVDTALMVLRQNTKTNKTRVDGIHKVFRTDEGLNPSEISELLGIDVDHNDVISVSTKKRSFNNNQVLLVSALSFIIGVGGLAMYMYIYKIGFFHPSAVGL